MLFHGAITGAHSTDEEGLLVDTRLGGDLISGGFSEGRLKASPSHFLHCEFAPDRVEGCDDIFDVYSPAAPTKLVIPKVKIVDKFGLSLPIIDVGFAFAFPLAKPGISPEQILDWERSSGVRIADGVVLQWVSDEKYSACPLDRETSRVLRPR